jgi:hypothetical protein
MMWSATAGSVRGRTTHNARGVSYAAHAANVKSRRHSRQLHRFRQVSGRDGSALGMVCVSGHGSGRGRLLLKTPRCERQVPVESLMKSTM